MLTIGIWSNFAVSAGWGGKKLLDMIGQDGFSEKEERLRVRTDFSYRTLVPVLILHTRVHEKPVRTTSTAAFFGNFLLVGTVPR